MQIKVNGRLLSEEESAAWAAEKAKKNKGMFAELAAEGRGIGVTGTDTQFRQGNHRQFEKSPAIMQREMKRRRGYSGNAVWHNQLGEYVESVSDIKRAAQRKNKTVELDDGKVLHQGHYVPEVRPPLADHIVKARMLSYAKQDPSLVSTPEKVKKLHEDVINKHTPHWRKKDKIIE